MKLKKLFSILAAVLVLFTLSVSAVAADVGDGDIVPIVIGAKPITADEAKRALSIALDTDITYISAHYVFVEDANYNIVNVHLAAPGDVTMVETIFYANNGDICGASGWAVTPANMLEYFIGIIASGVDGIMDLGVIGFSFLMGNAYLAFVICSGFAFTAFVLLRSAAKTSKRV